MVPATEQIWTEFASRLRRFIRRRVRSRADAEDVLQDVFVRIHGKLPTLRDDQRLAPWLFRIARHVIVDHRRRAGRAGVTAAEFEAVAGDRMPVSAGSRSDRAAEVAGWLDGMVAGLPATLRDAVRLTEFEGLTQTALAARLELSVPGAKSRVQRGRALIRRRLLECCHFEFDRRGKVIDVRRRPSGSTTIPCHCRPEPPAEPRRSARTVAVAAGLLLALTLLGTGGPAEAAATTTRPRSTTSKPTARRPAPAATVPLVWHVESLDGRVLDGKDSDRPINPASVVKIATSAWALEKLGPQHRFSTRLVARGTIDRARRVLVGDLVVLGSGDPDFHVENAFLLATQLNDLGIDTVRGRLLVTDRFWIGWENGSDGRAPTPAARGDLMASRLRRAMDSQRWDRRLQGLWRSFARRRGLSAARPARVAVTGEARLTSGPLDGTVLLEHLSKPLVETLRRFNCYSNNDIERLEATLGTPDDLEQYLLQRWQMPAGTLQLATTSGLGTNRLTPRLIVLLLRDFQALCRRLGVPVEAVLPMAGCDPGTLEAFRLLETGANANAVVAKTGTLVSTDGGIAVLAGFARTGQGEVLFCVAAPNAGRRLSWSRRAEERWVVDLISRHGGPRQRACQVPLPPPDQDAKVSIIGAI